MDEDLRNYKLQLQQVDAALASDPDNDELLKLKTDLEEVISLTKDLIKTQNEETSKESDSRSGSGYVRTNYNQAEVDDDVTASLLAAERGISSGASRKRKWKVGDKCFAKWDEDGQYYDAVIDEIHENTVSITFAEYNQKQSTNIDALKEFTGVKRAADEMGDDKHGKPVSRDYLKKKKQKKQQRFKQIEEDRESEKNKWLSFKAKTSKNPGLKTKSIFASPENINGRVGIGTCGISGKPMTEFSYGEKWKKGA